MFKINIVKNNIITNTATFNTEEEAVNWYNSNIFGKKEGLYPKSELNVEELSSVLYEVHRNYIDYCYIPNQYTMTIEEVL